MADNLHHVEKPEFLEIVTVKAELADQLFVTSCGDAVVGIAGQMLVAVVGHVVGQKLRAVVVHAYVVEELGETTVTVIAHGAAVHVDAVVDVDVDVLKGVEAIFLLVIIGAVAVEVGRVVADVDIAYQTHGVGVGDLAELAGMFDVDHGAFTLLGPSEAGDQTQ